MRRALIFAAIFALGTWPAQAQLSLLGLQNSLIQFALARLSTPGSFEITAGNVVRNDEGATELVDVRVADGKGVWLEIDGLSLSWNAARILRLQLQINRLAARGVSVLRRPETADLPTPRDGEPQPLTFAWPRSPITTRIDDMRLDGVRIAAGVVAAQSLAFDAQGAARDEGDIQSAKLTLHRTDDVEGRIDLDYQRDFASDTLKLNLEADEAAGGLVAALAGFPADSATRLSVNADGPLSDWRMTFDASAERVFAADGAATVIVGPPLSVDATMTIHPGPSLSPAVAAALSPEAKLVARVREGADGVIGIEEGAITSPELSLTASGSFARASGAVALDVDLAARSGLADLVDGVDFTRIGFIGSVDGALDDLTARGAVVLDGLRTAPVDVGAAQLETTVALKGASIGFDVAGGAEGLRLDRIAARTVGKATLEAAGVYDAGALTLARLDLKSPLLNAQASGSADFTGGDARLDYAVEAPDLAPIAKAYDTDAGGAFRVTGELTGPLEAPGVRGSASLRDLTFQGEPYGRVELSHDVTIGPRPYGRVEVTAEGSPYGPAQVATDFRLADRILALSDMTAQALGATAEGAVAINLDTTLADGEVGLRIADLAALGQRFDLDLAGALSGDVGLRTENGAQTVALDLKGSNLAGFDASIDALGVDAVVNDARGAPSAAGKLTATGLAAAGARIGSLQLEGSGSNLLRAPEAKADAVIGDIALDAIRTARVTLDARLSQGATGARLTAKAAATPTRIGDMRIGAADIDLRLDDAFGARVIGATASIAASDLGAVRLDRTRATVSGPQDALAVRLDAVGGTPDGKAVSLATKARVNAADAASVIADISTLEARYDTAVMALRKPARVRIGETIALSDLDLGLPGGALRGAASLHPDGLSGDLTLAMHDLAPLAELAAAPIRAGALDAEATFDTRPGRARARIGLSGRGIAPLGIASGVGVFGLDADATWNGRRAETRVELSGPFGDPMTLTAATALRASGGLLPTVPRGAGVDGRIAWRGRLGDLWALVPAPDHMLDGDVAVDLAFSGPLDAPDFSGEVSMRDGLYQNLELGTILNNLALTSRIAANGALELELTADDGSGHPVRGKAQIADGAVTATVGSNRAILVRRDDATAEITLDITANGPLTGPTVAGTVTIERAEIRLVNAMPPSVATLGDVRIKGAPTPEPTEPASGAVGLDIRISGPGDIFVRGRGLDSEWRADLRVGGTAARPEITGKFERVRGVLSLVGFPFDLERGEIRFTGATPIDPVLDIALTRENDGVTGGIFVRGVVSEPKVTFESTPALPQGEVLPRVLFGTSQQSLSAGQALQLAAGLGALLNGSGGPLDAVRNTVGIDVLRFEGDAEGSGGTVTVGNNVADGVFVGAKQPVDGSPGSVMVEIEIFDNVTVDSEVGSTSGASVGLNWRMDF